MSLILKFQILSVREPVTYLCSGQRLALQTLPSSLSNYQQTWNQNKVEDHKLQTRLAADNVLQILFTNKLGGYLRKAGAGGSDFTVISAYNRSAWGLKLNEDACVPSTLGIITIMCICHEVKSWSNYLDCKRQDVRKIWVGF